jgi:hypothetical protein
MPYITGLGQIAQVISRAYPDVHEPVTRFFPPEYRALSQASRKIAEADYQKEKTPQKPHRINWLRSGFVTHYLCEGNERCWL